MSSIEIRLGALAPDISEQLADQNLTLPRVEMYQKQAHAITVLSLSHIATEGEANKMRDRLFKRIRDNVEDTPTNPKNIKEDE